MRLCGTKRQNLRDDGIRGVVGRKSLSTARRIYRTNLGTAGLEAGATNWPLGVPVGTPQTANDWSALPKNDQSNALRGKGVDY